MLQAALGVDVRTRAVVEHERKEEEAVGLVDTLEVRRAIVRAYADRLNYTRLCNDCVRDRSAWLWGPWCVRPCGGVQCTVAVAGLRRRAVWQARARSH